MASGLHYNDTDITEWIARSDPGHANYLVGNSNNQGWPNIAARAAAFKAAPLDDVYTGVTRSITEYVRQGDTPMPNLNPNNYARHAVNAGFYYLVTGDTTYADAVKALFVAQMAEAKTDFSNTTHWDVSQANENGPFWGICEWLVRLIHAFDYIKDYLTPTEKTDIETWLYNAGSFFHTDIWNIQAGKFEDETDRANGILKNPGSWGDPNVAYNYDSSQVYTHRDASFTHYNALRSGNKLFSNRSLAIAQFVGLCGIYFSETNWINNAKYLVKNNIRMQLFPDGFNAEFLRTTTDEQTDKGWTYTVAIGSYFSILADALYRIGDSELYAFLTAEGFHDSAGGNKSIRLQWQSLCKCVDETVLSGNPAYEDRSVSNNSSTIMNGPDDTVRQCWSVLSNMYYRDSVIEDGYKMTNTGGYPSNPEQGNVSYMMQGAIIPDALFMWGDRQYEVSGRGVQTLLI